MNASVFRLGVLLSAVLIVALSVQGVSAGELTADEIWTRIGPFFSPPAKFAGELGDYRSPLKFYDGRPVRTAEDWKQRRAEILSTWHRMMGAWPAVIEKPKVEYLEKKRRENFIQHRVRFLYAQKHATEGYLLIPNGEGRRPAGPSPAESPR